tara:strand:+ start:94 stop:393 length:300 start_codon:yes stop_codon:yes gene_type:complete
VNKEELIKAKLKPRKAKKEWKMFALLGFVGSCVVIILVGVIVFPLLDNYDISERVKGMIVVMISFTIGYTAVYRQITKDISEHEDYRKHLKKLKRKHKL